MESCRALLNKLGRCIAEHDGRGLASGLSVTSPEASVWAASQHQEVAALAARFGEHWAAIVARQVCAQGHWKLGQVAQAYDLVVAAYNSLLNAMRDEGGWVVPVVRTLTREARVVAEKADASTRKQETLRDVEKTLKKGFSACWTDKTLGKRPATLYVVTQLLKIYFKLNLMKLAQPLTRPLGKINWTEFPKADVVAYRFFLGRLRLFEDQYADAEDHLAYAFEKCPRGANKRAILEFLLPVRLRRGKLPTDALLLKYGLKHFVPLVDAVKKGDLRTFNAQLAMHQMAFVKNGTFLLLEKVKILVHRNLCKKIYLVANKSPQLKLHLFTHAFAWLGMPLDTDEIECTLANLIFKGLLKGYISHAKLTLVVSKKDPFPALNLVDS